MRSSIPDVGGFARAAQGFTRSPLGIIALFIVLVYGFASIVAIFGDALGDYGRLLVYFLVGFPVVVFLGFLWLVARHNTKLYAPTDFTNDEAFLRSQGRTIAALAMASVSKEASGDETNTVGIDEIVSSVRNTASVRPRRFRILWVDDEPRNNRYLREAMMSQGIEVRTSETTGDAMDRLRSESYNLVITDMGRREGPREGYELLSQMRQEGYQLSVIIYSSSDRPEHVKEAMQRGAILATNRPNAVYGKVMEFLQNN